ncbi:hypothetical protein VaNZ11_006556 [Volvox africanus]|uniref:Peptidase M28 domain-containing protein n=1 Tax=Volvox africanus TaxID=51714 RepID=A0ABQ5S109_9CHLO|nr:hypothetical protein VaNZ11_006556 [Volvox africanus]
MFNNSNAECLTPLARKGPHDEPAKKSVVPWANPRLLVFILFVYYAAMLPLMIQRLHWTPPALPASSPAESFSEERAMRHVEALAGRLPDRQISMPQLRQAHDYIVRQGSLLAEMAAARGGDVEVKVFRENVSGSVAMDFGGVPFTNAYRELTNIVVTITPGGTEGRRGLLVAAHHDSAVTSPGASDDVSMVAVMLEAARALLSRPSRFLPAVPLVLLFDGAEESICQGGHGFFNSSPHARGLGAFINLEAMGSGGLPILFQHTGAWTVAAWAKGAKTAHGARIAQDIFDTGIIPGDTDYRMFSARHFGSLPGLDIAFIRDSKAYHSHLDSVARLRKGAMQDMGEALLGGLMSMAEALAADVDGRLLTPKALKERSVYFDLMGCGMITYPDHLASLLHTAPLAMFMMLPLASVAGGHTAAGVMTRMLSAAGRAIVALTSALMAPAFLGILMVWSSGVAMSWYAQHRLAYAIFLPISVAAAVRPWIRLREESLEQRPLQQGHYVACQVYGIGLVLSALATGLCFAGFQGFSQVLAMGGFLSYAVGSLLDNGAATFSPGALAGVLAVATVPLVVMGAILGTFLDVMMERMSLTGHHSVFLADSIIGVLTGCAVLGYSCCCLLPLLGYALGGLWDGSSSTGCSNGRSPGRSSSGGGESRLWRRLLLTALVATSLAMAIWSSTATVPYNADNPRRITITHLHETGSWVPEDDAFPASSAVAMSAAMAAAAVHPAAGPTSMDVQEPPPSPEEERRVLSSQLQPIPKIVAKLALGIADSNPWSQLFPDAAAAVAALPIARQGSAVRYGDLGHEYASLHPLERLLGKIVLEAEPAAQPPIAVPPYVRKLYEETREIMVADGKASPSSNDAKTADRRTTRVVHIRIFSEAHCWGMLNFTTAAPLHAWSLPSAPVAASYNGKGRATPDTSGNSRSRRRMQYYTYMVRFSHEATSPFWDLWIELDASHAAGTATDGNKIDPWVIVELSATYLHLTAELRAVRDAFPDWVTPTWIGTTFHSSHKL